MVILLLFVVLIWWTVPGLVLARRLYGHQEGAWGAVVLAGPTWGYAASSVVLLGLWAAGFRSAYWLLTAPVWATLLVWPAGRLAGTVTAPALSRREVAAWAFVLLTIIGVVGRPFMNVGSDTSEGRAYRAYFTADFVWAMVVAAELSKGEMPPKNPYYVDDSLHYYWLVHLLPAVEYAHASKHVSVERLLIVNAASTALMFGGFFYFFVRHFTTRSWAAAIACGGVLWCSSFEGLERLVYAWRRTGSLEFQSTLNYLRTLNIDAVANWSYQGMKVDGLHRMLLYQPQHQVGYVLGFSSLLLLASARDCWRMGLLFICGVLVGLSLLFSSFAGGIFLTMTAAYLATRLSGAPELKRLVLCGVSILAPFAAAWMIGRALHYVDPVSGGKLPLSIGLNPVAAHRVPLIMALNFGPVLLFAMVGVGLAVYQKSLRCLIPLATALAVFTLFYFFVDVLDVQNVYAGLNIGKMMFIALTPFVAIAIAGLPGIGRSGTRWTTTAAAVVVALAAIPTVLIDVFNTQDVSNRLMGPGFRWTVVLSPQELDGLRWIRTSTSKDARIQVDPVVRGRDTWAYITAFGERRMAGGIPLGMVPLAKYEAISARINEQIYQSTVATEANRHSRDLCVDYVTVGPPERSAYPHLEPLFDDSPDSFKVAFRNPALTVYEVVGNTRGSNCS